MHETLQKKQISIFVRMPEYLVIRAEAARQKISMNELCRRWMQPRIDRLNNREQPPCL